MATMNSSNNCEDSFAWDDGMDLDMGGMDILDDGVDDDFLMMVTEEEVPPADGSASASVLSPSQSSSHHSPLRSGAHHHHPQLTHSEEDVLAGLLPDIEPLDGDAAAPLLPGVTEEDEEGFCEGEDNYAADNAGHQQQQHYHHGRGAAITAHQHQQQQHQSQQQHQHHREHQPLPPFQTLVDSSHHSSSHHGQGGSEHLMPYEDGYYNPQSPTPAQVNFRSDSPQQVTPEMPPTQQFARDGGGGFGSSSSGSGHEQHRQRTTRQPPQRHHSYDAPPTPRRRDSGFSGMTHTKQQLQRLTNSSHAGGRQVPTRGSPRGGRRQPPQRHHSYQPTSTSSFASSSVSGTTANGGTTGGSGGMPMMMQMNTTTSPSGGRPSPPKRTSSSASTSSAASGQQGLMPGRVDLEIQYRQTLQKLAKSMQRSDASRSELRRQRRVSPSLSFDGLQGERGFFATPGRSNSSRGPHQQRRRGTNSSMVSNASSASTHHHHGHHPGLASSHSYDETGYEDEGDIGCVDDFDDDDDDHAMAGGDASGEEDLSSMNPQTRHLEESRRKLYRAISEPLQHMQQGAVGLRAMQH